MKYVLLKKNTIVFLLAIRTIGLTYAQPVESPITIKLVKDNFATITHAQHSGNRTGYRFHEHSPMGYGPVPLTLKEAHIDTQQMHLQIREFKQNNNTFLYTREIKKSEDWSRQDWNFHMLPVDDGIEILLVVRTYEEGLPLYYGIQQCFRMSGETNVEWRKEIANSPALSEYDLWNSQRGQKQKQSLTYIFCENNWEHIPAVDNTVGARTPMGLAVDYVRFEGEMKEKIGPYNANMLDPITNGLITRVDKTNQWICGIYWENTSHVTDHHPADCIHAIVNIGNIPPFSERVIQGKIYWFNGSKEDLRDHYLYDFIETKTNILTIASCQFPVSNKISENAWYIKKQIRLSKIRGAEVIHFPECALSGYGGADFYDFSDFDWQTLRAQTGSICELANNLNTWIILGSTHPLSEGNKPHNSLYVINPEGKVIDRYDKRFCTTGDLEYYTPGDHFVNFKIKNVDCGLLICYDVRFPELYREYSKLGVDIIFQSFYNARHKENCIHPKIMPVSAQTRAATNSFYMSLTNSSAPYSWPCHFITPDGLIVDKLPANVPGILLSEVDLSTQYYDASSAFRKTAIEGKLNSGETLLDPRSTDRTSY